MRIFIIGCGLAGLTAYLQLRKKLSSENGGDHHSITILEKTTQSLESPVAAGSETGFEGANSSPSTFNGGLGIAPNGLTVLKRLDSAMIYPAVKAAGHIVHFHEFRTSAGYVLGQWPAHSTALAAVKNTKESNNRKNASEKPNRSTSVGTGEEQICEGTCMIDRKRLWEILRSQVPDDSIRCNAKVTEVLTDGTIKLQDGANIKADLVVGADGVRSIARRCVLDEGESGIEPDFQQLMNIGGYVPSAYLEEAPAEVQPSSVMTFGRTGFVGYTATSTATSEQSSKSKPDQHDNTWASSVGQDAMWWATYTDEPSADQRRTTNEPNDPALRMKMQGRCKGWSDPVIQRIIDDLVTTPTLSSVVEHHSSDEQKRKQKRQQATLNLHTPTWVLPKLPRWTRGRVVLVGDAAHALPSTSGQGVSQAFEDSVAIAHVVLQHARHQDQHQRQQVDSKHVDADSDSSSSNKNDNSLEQALRKYEALRKPRVERILDEALRMQNDKRELSWLAQQIMYLILWLLLYLGGGKQEAWKFDYDIDEEMERHLN